MNGMNSIQRRFVDQDVRDDPRWRTEAERYLDTYTGDFKYLTEMRARHLLGMHLSDAMVRGVLNCMAGDPRVDLTVPTEPAPTAYGNVVSFRKPETKAGGHQPRQADCPLFANGIFHNHKRLNEYRKAGFSYCPGLYRINRTAYQRSAIIKTPYVVAVQGGVIHKADPHGYLLYYPFDHQEGFTTDPTLFAKGACGTQWFREPYLETTTENVPDPRPAHQGDVLRKCKRCFEEES